jgi:hypothetical protein
MSTTIFQEIENISAKRKKAYPLIIKGLSVEPGRLDAINVGKKFVTVVGKSRKTQENANEAESQICVSVQSGNLRNTTKCI